MSDTRHESLAEALTAAVLSSGGSKRVGALLRPDIDADDAGKWLMSALGRGREKLSLEHIEMVMRMGAKAGCHAPINRLTDTCGYARTQIADKEERRRIALEQIRAAQATLEQLEDQ